MPWRLLLAGGQAFPDAFPDGAPPPDTGPRNMAVDQVLFEQVQAGAPPALRLYRWHPACLSFGRNQRALGLYDPVLARRLGIDVVRRPTGGLAVLHRGELTYSVVAPARPLGGPRAAYVRINRALVTALRSLGVPASIGGDVPTHVPHPDAAHPCFERPAPGEVVAAGRKLVGSAQRVERHTLLQHGSILLTGDQGDVVRLQPAGVPGPRGEITVAELLGSLPSWPALVAALVAAFESVLGIRLAPASLSSPARERVLAAEAQFAADEWTWRR